MVIIKKDAYKEYARAIGKPPSRLNKLEKRIAILNAVLTEGMRLHEIQPSKEYNKVMRENDAI